MDKEQRDQWTFVFAVMAFVIGALGVGSAVHPSNFLAGTMIVLVIAFIPALFLRPLNQSNLRLRLIIVIETLAILIVFISKTKK